MMGAWVSVKKTDPRARDLADRHYSRQTPGAACFTPPGRCVTLLTECERAIWAVVLNMDPAGALRWRVAIFRNEGAGLSSDLIRSATDETHRAWLDRYGEIPRVRLTTEVDPLAVRPKADPGYCFLMAGWDRIGVTAGARKGRRDLVIFGAPTFYECSTCNDEGVVERDGPVRQTVELPCPDCGGKEP